MKTLKTHHQPHLGGGFKSVGPSLSETTARRTQDFAVPPGVVLKYPRITAGLEFPTLPNRA
jgi:hypothetical protein